MNYDEASSIIKGYNKAIAGTSDYGKLVRTPGLFISAANRQSGRAYSSTYSALEGQTNPETGKEYTPEEIRKIALASGLLQGTITGLITSAFSFAGRGGLEDLVLAGANKSQVLKAINSFANTKGLSSSLANLAELCPDDCQKSIEYKSASETAANVSLTLFVTPKGSRNKVPILDIGLRYSGNFNADPQFRGTMTKEFINYGKKKST